MTEHHAMRAEVAPRRWDVAQPLRATGPTRWRAERACRRELGHCWHLMWGHLIDWFCCSCGAETDGLPRQRCKLCVQEGGCPP